MVVKEMSRRGAAALLFAGILALKLLLLALLGPLMAPDTPAYVEYATAIMADAGWRTRADLGATFAPNLVFRMMGFPLVVAGFKSLSASHWQWLFVGFQIVIAVLATCRLFVVLDRISGNRNLALGLAVAQATAINIAFDQFVLTDGLYLALMMFATCSIVEISLDRAVSTYRLFEISALFAGCFFLREATSTLILLWIPLLVIALSRAMSLRGAALVAALVVMPVFASQFAYKSWNQYRTGERFVTTSYQLVLLQPLVKAYRYDKAIFGGDELLDRVARQHVSRYHYDEVVVVGDALHREHGWNALHSAREIERRFWKAWREHPGAMLRATGDRLKFGYTMILVEPLSSVNFLVNWISAANNNAVSFGTLTRKTFKEGRIWYAPLWLFDLACRLASILILVSIMAGAAYLAWRIRTFATLPLALEALALTALAGGFIGAHVIVHLEERYMMPIVPVGLMVFAFLVRNRGALLEAWRGAPATVAT